MYSDFYYNAGEVVTFETKMFWNYFLQCWGSCDFGNQNVLELSYNAGEVVTLETKIFWNYFLQCWIVSSTAFFETGKEGYSTTEQSFSKYY